VPATANGGNQLLHGPKRGQPELREFSTSPARTGSRCTNPEVASMPSRKSLRLACFPLLCRITLESEACSDPGEMQKLIFQHRSGHDDLKTTSLFAGATGTEEDGIAERVWGAHG
jgi:hypothetical protein